MKPKKKRVKFTDDDIKYILTHPDSMRVKAEKLNTHHQTIYRILSGKVNTKRLPEIPRNGLAIKKSTCKFCDFWRLGCTIGFPDAMTFYVNEEECPAFSVKKSDKPISKSRDGAMMTATAEKTIAPAATTNHETFPHNPV